MAGPERSEQGKQPSGVSHLHGEKVPGLDENPKKPKFFHPELSKLRDPDKKVREEEWRKWYEESNDYYIRLAQKSLGNLDNAKEATAKMWTRLAIVIGDPERKIDHLPTYTRKILTNQIIDQTRRAGKSRAVDTELEFFEKNRDQSGLEQQRHVNFVLDYERLAQQLPPALREQIPLLLSGIGVKEIAERLGIPEGTVKSRRARALESLRGLMDEEAEREKNAGEVEQRVVPRIITPNTIAQIRETGRLTEVSSSGTDFIDERKRQESVPEHEIDVEASIYDERFVRQLAPIDQILIESLLRGETQKEVAKRLGVGHNAPTAWKARALARLKTLVEEEKNKKIAEEVEPRSKTLPNEPAPRRVPPAERIDLMREWPQSEYVKSDTGQPEDNELIGGAEYVYDPTTGKYVKYAPPPVKDKELFSERTEVQKDTTQNETTFASSLAAERAIAERIVAELDQQQTGEQEMNIEQKKELTLSKCLLFLLAHPDEFISTEKIAEAIGCTRGRAYLAAAQLQKQIEQTQEARMDAKMGRGFRFTVKNHTKDDLSS